MVDIFSRKFGPGFQGSETSRAEVIVYAHGDDDILLQPSGKFTFDSVLSQDGIGSGALTSVQTTKSLGRASGTFTFEIKPPITANVDLRDWFNDDDMVDIVFTRNNRRFHVMRGFIDDVRKMQRVDGSGATSDSFVISGRDHGKIWEQTPIFFNRYAGEDVGGGATLRSFAANSAIYGDVGKTVEAFLYSFLRELNSKGRANWIMPPGVPNIAGRTFQEVVVYNNFDLNTPPRVALKPHMINVQNQTLWQLAQAWSDPQFMELYTDLWELDGDAAVEPIPEKEAPENRTVMCVILRDRPFPTEAHGELFKDSAWFSLPLYKLARQEIENIEVGRGGLERKNAFFVQPKAIAEKSNNIDFAAPLWDKEDIKRHGLRRMDITSNYVAIADDLLGMTQAQREAVRDWFMLNPYFYNGQISIAHGRPDIHIGTRVRIPGVENESSDETYYVESVTNLWRYRSGMRTSLGVTRGWVGDDASLTAALQTKKKRYSIGVAANAKDISVEDVESFLSIA